MTEMSGARFYRANTSRVKSDSKAGGFGLGLSIAKMIADVHHGDITLRSQPGTGTTATVTIPVATAKKQQLPLAPK